MGAAKLSAVDQIYRSILPSKFFTKGWGSRETLRLMYARRKDVMDRDRCIQLVDEKPNVCIDKEDVSAGLRILHGRFESPVQRLYPDLVEPPVGTAMFEAVLPARMTAHTRVCIQLAGTGDHGYWRRRHFMAKPLAVEHGIGSILLENPFYGERKPPQQWRSCLRNVSDLFVMGGCLILESLTLLRWCENEGFGPLALTGISMGGHMASLAATNWPKPIALVPCLSGSTASCVFTKGVLANALAWPTLQRQYFAEHSHDEQLRPLVDRSRGQQQPSDGASSPQFAGFNFSTLRRVPPTHDQVTQFMRVLMDEFTHLGNFSRPVDTSLVIAVAAGGDAFVPRDGVVDLKELWPGAEVRMSPRSGHVAACLFDCAFFRKAIVDALERSANTDYP